MEDNGDFRRLFVVICGYLLIMIWNIIKTIILIVNAFK